VEDSLRKLVDACISREPGNPLWPDGVERFCIEHALPQDKFFFLFAKLVAEEFAHGLMSFADGNRAMNQLFAVADVNLRGFAWEVYGAFDSGEFRHDGDSDATISWQKYTLPQVMEALVREGLLPRG
jgi:hypothetical protein